MSEFLNQHNLLKIHNYMDLLNVNLLIFLDYMDLLSYKKISLDQNINHEYLQIFLQENMFLLTLVNF